MSLIKCGKCGELYSDSYRSCPFCAEDEEYYKGNVRKGNRRNRGTKKRTGILIPLLSLVLVVLIGGGVWYFYGTNIQEFFTRDKVTPAAETADPAESTEQESSSPVELLMDKTLRLAPDSSEKLKISGGTSYEWVSSDPTVATVSGSGVVNAVAEGTTIITAVDVSGASAVCSVTVAEETDEPDGGTEQTSGGTTTKPIKPADTGSSGTTTTKVDASKLKFSAPAYGTVLYPTASGTYDISIMKSMGESSFQLAVEGTSAKVNWTTANSNIATVDADGTFHAVNYGETTVTAKVGDAAVQFLVRVK